MNDIGVPVSEGLAFNKAFVYRHSNIKVDHVAIDEKNIQREKDLYLNAKGELLEEYYRLLGSSLGDEKEILDAHVSFLSDPDFRDSIIDYIENHSHSALWAVEAAGNKLVALLEGSEDEYLRERGRELNDLKIRLMEKISGTSSTLLVEEDSIIVADYLLVSELLSSDVGKIKGIALDRGGKTSHIAILARAFNIPLVVGLIDLSSRCQSGERIIINGFDGTVITKVDKQEIANYKALLKERNKYLRELNKEASKPSITTDGRRIMIKANVEGLQGIDTAISSGADGVGLFRTEFIFLRKELLNDEMRREEIYEEASEKMEGVGDVTFRTLDIGGDKALDGMGDESGALTLGMRSIRFCMKNKDIFHRQLVSILKASKHKNTAIMFPMISSRDELKEVLSYFESVKDELREKGIEFDENIRVGTMIEVPSAAMTADLIAPLVDFMSVGTNDLIQFSIAVDRGKDTLSHLYEPLHPGVLRLLKRVVDAGAENNVRVAICGEMASEISYLPLLIGLGFDELSVSAHSILEAKRKVRSLSYLECKRLADAVLKRREISEIKKEISDFNERRA